MDREEKGKGIERDGKKEEFIAAKLKRGILVGKREGVCTTPSPTWQFGLIQPDGTLIQEFNFSSHNATLSARKLCANLWEVQPHLNLNMSKRVPVNKLLEGPSEQPRSTSRSRRHDVEPKVQARHQTAERLSHPQQPVSPSSYSSSMEMAPYKHPTATKDTLEVKDKFGDSSHSLRTSTELIKVLNRIWKLEETQASHISLIKMLKRELDRSQLRIKELLKEKQKDQLEMDDLVKQLAEAKFARKDKEQDRMKNALQSLNDELIDERKLRMHSEKLHRKIARELSEMKSVLSGALRELERERKARILLEDLCDEFAKGIRKYEQEVRSLNNKYRKDRIVQQEDDQLILHISEAWLDERMQLKLGGAPDIAEKPSAVDKLGSEIEIFLQTKQSDSSKKHEFLYSRWLREGNLRRHSLESFHLNEAGSAPRDGNEEDSDNTGRHYSNLNRAFGLKPGSGSTRQQGEISQIEERAISQATKNKVQLQKPPEEPELPGSHIEGPTKESLIDEVLDGGASQEGKNRLNDGSFDVQNDSNKHFSLTSEGNKPQHDSKYLEDCFDPSTFAGPASPVQKWTSESTAPVPDFAESSSRWPQSMKPNTLKAKLMEARLEGQQARSRASKGLSQIDSI